MKPIVAFNWKLKPTTFSEAQKLARMHKKHAKEFSKKVQVISAPPVPFVNKILSSPSPLYIGAQNAISEVSGPYTGESSPAMLRSIGCGYVIVGHSERRKLFGETDPIVAEKAAVVLEQGLQPIVCFGEDARDDAGQYVDILINQLKGSLTGISKKDAQKLVLAYEPVWAIGEHALRPVTTDELFSTLILIKKTLVSMFGAQVAKKIPILYGGSVSQSNAEELAAVGGLSGFLVGGASHRPKEVRAIIASLS